MLEVFDSLELLVECDLPRPSEIPKKMGPNLTLPDDGFYVDYSNGSDLNDGTKNSPFKTIHHAIE